MKFGDFLREKRTERKLSIVQVARAVGISTSYMSSLEKGIRNPPPSELLNKIAYAYDLRGEERTRMLDLAAMCKNPPTLADDLVKYLTEYPEARNLLRLTAERKLKDDDWILIQNYIKRKY